MAKPGGITQVEGYQNSLEIEGLARFAVDEHNKKENTRLEFQKVVNAKQQVVAGFMYYITLEATDKGKKKIYEAKIWVKPSPNSKKLEEFKLTDDAPSDSTRPGGIIQDKGNQNSLEVECLARLAVNEHNKKENTLLQFQKVLHTKHQVVEGIMYYITLEATDGGKKKIYEAKIWVKPWLNFKELQEFKLIGDAPSDSTSA